MSNGQLNKTLGPVMIWALGVGYVISGMYFGWNLGLPEGGPYGMLVATLLMTLMYVAFVFSYAELSCSIPKAGGAFVYANEALGPGLGFLAGVSQCMEFVFAPPAIAMAIGAYFSIFFPGFPPLLIAFIVFAAFTGVNIYGVKSSAILELIITVLAVIELLIFAGMTLPSFTWDAFSKNPLPNGWWGVLPATPFAIWFYICIEGIANVAEETKNPQRDLSRGFGWAMFTLVVLTGLTFFGAVGVDGWETIVYTLSATGERITSDSPLPLALGKVVGDSHGMYHLLITIGLLGLLASFHGIILVAGRATFEFGRVGYLPKVIGTILPKQKTPAAALILNMLIGFATLLSGKTTEIITIAVFGALVLYIISMISLFRLRTLQPDLERPFKTPFYPFTPAIALLLASLSLAAMAYFNLKLFLVFLAMLAVAYIWFFFVRRHSQLILQGSVQRPLTTETEPG
jgi:ethanolamine permease